MFWELNTAIRLLAIVVVIKMLLVRNVTVAKETIMDSIRDWVVDHVIVD